MKTKDRNGAANRTAETTSAIRFTPSRLAVEALGDADAQGPKREAFINHCLEVHVERRRYREAQDLKHAARFPMDIPEGLTLEIEFTDSESWHGEYNALLSDKAGALFLADSDGERIANKPQPVTLLEALNWYVRCDGFSSSHDGDVVRLCELAAEELSYYQH